MPDVIPITLLTILILPQATSFEIIEEGTSFITNTQYRYQGATLICSQANDPCSISCNADYSCKGSTIHCPTGSGSCNIDCEQQYSCDGATIIGGGGRLNIACPVAYSCEYANIIAATSGNEDISISCGASDACLYTTINSTFLGNGDLDVACPGELRACSNTEIYCPLNGNCRVDCSERGTCYNPFIKAVSGTSPCIGDCDSADIVYYTNSPTMGMVTFL